MISIIKGCNIYAPNNIGIKDVLIAGGKIEGTYDELNIQESLLNIEIINS